MPARFNAVLNDLRQVIHGRPSYVNTASSGLGLRSGCSSSGSRLGRACSGKIESDCAWRKTSISSCELEQPKAGTEALGWTIALGPSGLSKTFDGLPLGGVG